MVIDSRFHPLAPDFDVRRKGIVVTSAQNGLKKGRRARRKSESAGAEGRPRNARTGIDFWLRGGAGGSESFRLFGGRQASTSQGHSFEGA